MTPTRRARKPRETRRAKLARLVQEAREAAENAVAHVGAANYADREAEADQWVRDAFDKIDDFLLPSRPQSRRAK